MSFFGGGTDIPEYFQENEGAAVISTTFDKYCYVVVRHLPAFFDYTSEICYSKIDRVTDVSEIEHPAVREAMKLLDMRRIRLAYEADLPAKSGLGSSSSFAVGMLNAFHCLKGKYTDKRTLADEAIYLERVLCGEAGGWQDQIAAAFGGFNKITFDKNGYNVLPIVMDSSKKELLHSNLLMFFTGFTRFSAEIQEKNNLETTAARTRRLKEMSLLTTDAEKVLLDRHSDLDEFGRLLNITWKLKRSTGPAISNSKIDDIYDAGIKAGALGGKLLGAGGGGFMIFYVPEEAKRSVRIAMDGLMEIPFNFENSGSTIIYYTPEDFNRFREDSPASINKG